MLTASYGIAVSAADAEIIDSGTLSDDKVSWTLDSEGLLYISGEGEIPDSWLFDWWYNDEDKYITKIVFDENCAISRIGEHALNSTDSTDIIINTTIPLTIGEGAIDTFSDSLNITINAPRITSIGFDPFYAMTDSMCIIFNIKEPVVFEKQLFGNPDIGWTDKDTHKYVVAVPNGSAYCVNGEMIPLTSQNTSEVFGEAQIRIKMPATASTCSEAGCTEHYAGSDGNTYVLEEDGWKKVTKDEITVPTLSHTYDAPAWTVNTDGSMTASFACTVCKETKTVTIPADQIQSLMGMSGSVTETWNWASDYSTARLKLSGFPAQALTVIQDENLRNEVAANGFTMQAGVTSTEVALTDATRGQKIYTAAVMYNKKEYTDKKIKIVSSTSRIVPEGWYASLGGFEEMVWRDFQDKHPGDERVFYADVMQTDENTVTCSILEWQGKSEPLEVYTIDVRTGIGTNQAGEEINLPQTGVTAWNTAAAVGSAFVLVSAGLWLTIIAARKKESGEMPSVGQVSSI